MVTTKSMGWNLFRMTRKSLGSTPHLGAVASCQDPLLRDLNQIGRWQRELFTAFSYQDSQDGTGRRQSGPGLGSNTLENWNHLLVALFLVKKSQSSQSSQSTAREIKEGGCGPFLPCAARSPPNEKWPVLFRGSALYLVRNFGFALQVSSGF